MPGETTVAVAMSGGVDSSVAASVLRDAGCRVIGVTMILHGLRGPRALRPGDAAADARAAAEILGIPHHTVDFRRTFERRVIADFCREYGLGRTPNPCLRCNRLVKFGLLWKTAVRLGADFLATGHYARVGRDPDSGLFVLRKARDRRKDQTYFLFALGQDALSRTLLPLGELTKPEVRSRARTLGLPAARRPESQEICFVPDDDYPRFLADRIPGAFVPGEIVDSAGGLLGRHRGIGRYTVGQRRGLGVAGPHPLYVVSVDAPANRIVAGPDSELLKTGLLARNVVWVSGVGPGGSLSVKAKIRSRQRESEARVSPLPGKRALVRFRAPQRAVTPGQAVVFYRGDEVVGGGLIESAVE